MKHFTLALVLSSFAALQSCSSVKYGDPNETETVNIDFGSTDGEVG